MNNMNNRIRLLAEQAGITFTDYGSGEFLDKDDIDTDRLEKFVELLLRNLSEELLDVARRSRPANPEWANGMYHAAMLAQRMTMDLPQWPEAE